MEISRSSQQGVPVVRVSGEVDHATVSALKAAITETMESNSGSLLLDFTDCPYLDSAGLSVLLETARILQGRPLVVMGANKNLLRIFEIAGLFGVPGFRVADTVGDAGIASL